MKLRHPLSILALGASPFVCYSFWRTGYSVGQLFEMRLFRTRYVYELAFLALAIGACCVGFEKRGKGVFGLAAGLAIVAFLALQAGDDYPSDYKLWIYVVAPIFVWSLLLTATFSFGVKLMKKKNA